MSSNNLSIDERLSILHGGKVSDETKQYILRVKEAAGIKSNDELFTVLLLTTHISKAINDAKMDIQNAPFLMQEATDKIINDFKDVAKLAIEEASAVGLQALAKSVSGVANKVARQTATKQLWQWAVFCILATAMVLASVGFVAYNAGFDTGYSVKAFSDIKTDIKSECFKTSENLTIDAKTLRLKKQNTK